MISSAATSVVDGQAVTVTTTSASSISKVTWIRRSAVTHSFDQSQPAEERPHMLFLVNSSGVPSKAKIVKLN